jgi:hypothetical protein
MRSILRRGTAVVLSAAVIAMLSGGLPLIAQEAGKTQVDATAKKTAKRAFDPTRRVPDYFAQLGLSAVQKESIYKIRAKHQPQIDAAEKQLQELRAQAIKDCESVLTDAQRRMLAERRAAAAEAQTKRVAGKSSTAKPQD